MDSCPFESVKLRSNELDLTTICKYENDFFVFGNIAKLRLDIIAYITRNLHYVVIESDYKYCVYRTPEGHTQREGYECDCHKKPYGKIWANLFMMSKCMFWKSKAQLNFYISLFPELKSKQNEIVSGVFSNEDMDYILSLRGRRRNNKYLLFASNIWVKGFEDAINYSKANKIPAYVAENLSYTDMLTKMSDSKGIIYLPKGKDTCPRFVTEAKLLGIDYIINDNVQQRYEDWFTTDNIEETINFLKGRIPMFWNTVIKYVNEEVTV